MGPPLFVPGTDRFSTWKFVDRRHTGPESDLTAIVATASLGVRLDVETVVDRSAIDVRNLASRLLSASVPEQVRFPFTVTISEHSVDVPMANAAVTLRAFECGGPYWIAYGTWHKRGLVLRARGLPPAEVRIDVVEDLTALAEDRWGGP
jgi:hypothetical protein